MQLYWRGTGKVEKFIRLLKVSQYERISQNEMRGGKTALLNIVRGRDMVQRNRLPLRLQLKQVGCVVARDLDA
jgi:hypothetical protein